MPVITLSNPQGVRAPASRYSHAALVAGAHRRLVVSGQVGQEPDGTVPATGEGQIAQAYANLRAVLEAHGMGISDVVKTTAFLTDRSLIPAYRAARDAVFADHAPASTLLVVAGLADARWVVEIEAEAAR
ncbi:MAG: RidA family protein [Rhodospirillales bacterium]|jgi:enamine deaminase RidA (YjgF/YER057c/UK114 family)|nr:RidA family protein [Rhodospirillales bacterium]